MKKFLSLDSGLCQSSWSKTDREKKWEKTHRSGSAQTKSNEISCPLPNGADGNTVRISGLISVIRDSSGKTRRILLNWTTRWSSHWLISPMRRGHDHLQLFSLRRTIVPVDVERRRKQEEVQFKLFGFRRVTKGEKLEQRNFSRKLSSVGTSRRFSRLEDDQVEN